MSNEFLPIAFATVCLMIGIHWYANQLIHGPEPVEPAAISAPADPTQATDDDSEAAEDARRANAGEPEPARD